jgi:enoyl-CoA hydratase
VTSLTPPAPGARRAGRVHLAREGALARIVLDNPDVRNALTTAMYDQLRDICLELAADRALRMVAIRGAGGVFAAGTDVADLVAIRNGAEGVAYEGEITRVLDAVRALQVPVVALVEGPAVGGGLAIVACCDLVYATPDARFGAPVARTLGNCVSPATTARCAPLSVAAAKEFGRRLDDQAAAVEHDDVYAQVYGSVDFAEGVAAFLEHRPPVWRGE